MEEEEEVVRAWCSAKPNSWSVQRANALPVMCGTGRKKKKKHTTGLLAGFTKTPSLTNTLPESERGSVAHPGMRQTRRTTAGEAGEEAWPESCSCMIEERPRVCVCVEGGRRKRGRKNGAGVQLRCLDAYSICLEPLKFLIPQRVPGKSDSLDQMAETNGEMLEEIKGVAAP